MNDNILRYSNHILRYSSNILRYSSNILWYSIQYITVQQQYITVQQQYITVQQQYSMVQYTIYYGTVQYTSVQYNILQYSTVVNYMKKEGVLCCGATKGLRGVYYAGCSQLLRKNASADGYLQLSALILILKGQKRGKEGGGVFY